MQLLHSTQAHSGPIWSISTHATLPLLATASQDKTSKIYSLSQAHNLLAILEQTHTRSIRSISFKPPLDNFDLPVLACGSFDSTISIWGIDEPEFYSDVESEFDHSKIICSPNNEWNLMALIEGHENEVKSVSWNSQGNLLASCSRDKTVWIWETDQETLEEFECIAVLNDHEHDVKYVCWHPTRNILASCSYDDTIRIYAEDDHDDEFTCVGVLNGHEGTVWSCQFEQTDSNRIRLASVSSDLTVRIWQGNVPERNSEKQLPSSIKHNREMVWEQECILPQAHTFPIYSIAWSKSGRIATCGSDGKIVVYKEANTDWEIETSYDASHGVSEVNCIVWANLEGKEILVSGGDDGCVKYWSI